MNTEIPIFNPDLLNNEFYNSFSGVFDQIPFDDVLPGLFEQYLTKPSCEILEIGSGTGALALWIQNKGHKVKCIEPAEVPAQKARDKGLEVYQIRFQEFETDQKFDCIMAISSLIHIPLSEMATQISRMAEFLTPNGIAIVSFIEGEGEFCEDPTGKGKKRCFSKLTEDKLHELLSPYFLTLENKRIRVEVMKQFFLLLVLKKL